MINKLAFAKISKALADYLTPSEKKLTKANLLTICTVIFLIALLVKILYWQDNYLALEGMWSGLGYDTEAERILSGKGILFPQNLKLGDARILNHPPGYSILMAIFSWLFGNSTSSLVFFQIICDSLAAVMTFLIALELLPLAIAFIASLFVSFSPHFAYYGLILSPDPLIALPILVAIYFIILAIKDFSSKKIAVAGIILGLCCWLRPNAMVLSPFLAIALLPCFARKDWLRYGVILVASTVIVILPITIRNFIIFKEFIPISIGVGVNLVEGIADYDKEKRFGFPSNDQDVARIDGVWLNRPDYKGNLWFPDGIERDKNRVKRAVSAIKSDPIWFLGIALHRATFMLRYNDKGSHSWPFNTAIVPIVNAEAPFNHPLTTTEQPNWTASPSSLSSEGKLLSPQATLSLSSDNQALTLQGDSSEFNNQFISQPIKVSQYTDYILKVSVKLQQGQAAIKVLNTTQNNTLVSTVINQPQPVSNKNKALSDGSSNENNDNFFTITLSFASEKTKEVVLAFSNNGTEKPIVLINKVELYSVGSTPYVWTHYPRLIIRGIQKNLYNTNRLLPLVLIGILLILGTGRKQLVLGLLAVPLYYFCLQSILHTEYRYILAVHYFLFIVSASTCYFFGKLLIDLVGKGIKLKLSK